MKKLLILLLLFFTFIPNYAFGIDIQKKGTTQHGGMRTPSITCVSADYENGLITVDVKGYTGGIQVLVSDQKVLEDKIGKHCNLKKNEKLRIDYARRVLFEKIEQEKIEIK